MAAEGTSFLDLLEDEVVQDIVRRIPGPWQLRGGAPGAACVAATCRRFCTLARKTRQVRVITNPEGALLLARAPPSRAFHHVYHLELRYTDVTDIQHWALYGEAAAAAATTWLGLEEAELCAKSHRMGPAGEPGGMSSALLALRHAPALRRLQLDLPDQFSLLYVAALTQLTHLELRSWDDFSVVVPHATNSRPLANMPHLLDLELHRMVVNEDVPCALAPNLTYLVMVGCWGNGDEGNWWAHVAGCQHLQKLSIMDDLAGFMTLHPTLLLQAIAGQLTQLTELYIDREPEFMEDEEEDSLDILADVLDEMLQADNMDEEPGENWMPVPPLIGFTSPDNTLYTSSYVIVPPPNMGELTSLQQLYLNNWWLVVSSERYWRALAGCSSLRSLKELHASVAPPAGVTFAHLTWLNVTTSTSPGDTVILLGAFPALEVLWLTVAPRGISHTQPPSSQVTLDQVTTAFITLLYPQEVAWVGDPGQHLAGYCTALWGALPCLRDLHLQWPCHVPLLRHLPSVSALQQLLSLHLCNRIQDREPVQPRWVLQAVQGATQLRALHVFPELVSDSPDSGGSKSELVLGLQRALPGLTLLGLRDGDVGLSPDAVAALRPGLRLTAAW